MLGIIGYGVYLPTFRIKLADIAEAWNRTPVPGEKTVPAPDETPLTMGRNAVDNALKHANIPPEDIGAVYFCSNSSMIEGSYAQDIAFAIGLNPSVTIADLHGSPRSFTTAIQLCFDAIKAQRIKTGLIIGSDILVGGLGTSAGDAASEYVSAAGAGAILLGTENVLVEFEAATATMAGLKERWRSLNDPFPRVGDGRFIRDVGYITQVVASGKALLAQLNRPITDFTHVVLQQPHFQWVSRALGKLGIPKDILKTKLKAPGAHVSKFGDLGAACLPVALAEVLDSGQLNETVLMISFGAGGSDASSWILCAPLIAARDRATPVAKYQRNPTYVNYTTHLKYNKVISQFT